jgi:hypothetical protein
MNGGGNQLLPCVPTADSDQIAFTSGTQLQLHNFGTCGGSHKQRGCEEFKRGSEQPSKRHAGYTLRQVVE